MCLHYMEMASKDKKKKKISFAVKIGLAVKKNCDDLVVKIWGGACVPRISVLDSLMALPVRIGEI